MKKRSNKGKSRQERTRGEGYEAPAPKPDLPIRVRLGGRPSKFSEDLVDEVAERCRNGATDSEIALEFGIATSTIYVWRDKYPHFAAAMDEGKAKFDEKIERSYAMRAAGFSYESEKVFSNGTRARVIEYMPPDPGAAHNWLVQRGRFKAAPQLALGDIMPPDTGASQAEIGVRALAIGALALLGAAAHNTQQPATIDATPNRQEEIDDEDESDAERPGELRRRSEGSARAGERGGKTAASAEYGREPDDRDPDFDF